MSKLLTSILILIFSFQITAQQKVLNGRDAEEHEFPWMCTFSIDGYTGCGGTVINSEWVLTAAHCMWGFFSEDPIIDVLINPYQMSSPKPYTEIIAAESIHFYTSADSHPDSIFGEFHDLALVKLALPTSFEPVKFAAAEDEADYHVDQFPAHLLGWGLDENFMPNDILQYGQPKIIGQDTCNLIYQEHPNVYLLPSPWEICAGYRVGEEAQGAASGDSGGPLLILNNKDEFVQVGVVSRGDGGPITTDVGPGIFTNVARFADWINETMAGGPTSTKSLDLKNHIKLKRFADHYEIELVDIRADYLSLEIYDLSGRKLVSGKDLIKKTFASISTQELSEGMYILHVQTDQGNYSYKFRN